MTTKTIVTIPRLAFSMDDGGPASGYLLYTYATGSSTPATTWQDQAGTTANTNPIVLDARGECTIWVTPAQEYRLVLKTPTGTTEWTEDDVSGASPTTAEIPEAIEDPSGHTGPLVTNGTTISWLDSGMDDRNRVINGAFNVNSIGVVSPVTLDPFEPGHSKWVAGAGSCTYSFAAAAGLTTVTIVSGSLVQTISEDNVPAGATNCTLSWVGTAQGRIGAGSYASSPITASVPGGIALPIEFGLGTVTKVQFEPGSIATPYSARLLEQETYLAEFLAGGSNADYITGAQITVTANDAISVSSGSAGFEAGGEVLWTAPITAEGLAIGVNTLYYVYVYNGEDGATLEVSTTTPATTYQGSARSKTGATNYRFLGAVRSDASSHLIRQKQYQSGEVRYLVAWDSAAFTVLSNGGATSETDVALSSFIPIGSVAAVVDTSNSSGSYSMSVSDSNSGLQLYTSGLLILRNQYLVMPCDSSRNISYWVSGGSNANIYLQGYILER